MEEPYVGAHIRVLSNGVYHHGIFIGDDQVIQFGGPFDMFNNPEDIKVEQVHISKFLNQGFLEVRKFSFLEKRKKNKDSLIVEIAKSKLGEKGYHILNNNCEHFVNYCIFNKKTSAQVDDIRAEVKNKLGIK